MGTSSVDVLLNQAPYLQKINQRSFLSTIVSAATLVFTLIFFGATNIYFSNTSEFTSPFFAVLIRLLAASLVTASLLTIAIRALPLTSTGRAIPVVVALAMASWIQGNLLVWDYGVFDGRSIEWMASWHRGVIDGVVWAACLAVALARPRAVYAASMPICAALLLIQAFTLVDLLLKSNEHYSENQYVIDASTEFSFSREANVLLFVLDSFQSDVFEETISERPELKEAFSGFTYYRNATAGYSSTYPSIPLMLTGQYFDNSLPYQDFIRQAYLADSSLPKRLTEAGYRVDLFPWIRQTVYFDESVFANFRAAGEPDLAEGELKALLCASLFRHTPHFAKPLLANSFDWSALAQEADPTDTEKHGRDVRARGIDGEIFPRKDLEQLRDLRFVERMTRLATVSDSAPTFKYYHLLGLHPPIQMNERLQYEELSESRVNYRRYAAGILAYMRIVLDKLRDLGTYGNSLIIIAADHGLGIQIPDPHGDQRMGRGLPLVLLKPPLADAPLNTSDAPVSLSDIPATVLSITGVAKETTSGLPFSASSDADQRPRTFYQHLAGNWSNEFLQELTEYKVTGFSWDAKSWQPTGRILKPALSIEAFHREIENTRHLGRPILFTESPNVLPSYFYGIVEFSGDHPGLVVRFPDPDPQQGDLIGVSLPLQELRRGQDYVLSFDILDDTRDDQFHSRLTKRFKFGVFLGKDEIELQPHESGPTDLWRNVKHTFTAGTPETELTLQLETLVEPEKGWLWGKQAKIGIRSILITEKT